MGQKLLLAGLTILAGVRGFAGHVPLNLMPMPAKVVFGEGSLPIDGNFAVAVNGTVEPRITAAVERLFRRLSNQTHLTLAPKPIDATRATLVINCGPGATPGAEDESYGLAITPTQARLTAPTALGVLRGIETFLQLVQSADHKFSVPVLSIDDKPRFSWRGLHLDVSRHWMPMDVVLRNLDGMAAVKLNVFHWHLSDDQGFRVESKVFPKLHQMGSDGQYYTQDQVRHVVAYARDRGIRVVPEFDMPAHTTAWFVGYPDLASAPRPYEIGR
ncbi:MAG: family 20 glycosylhydrolase, partial [Acidobacteriota bacterium]|nr:family 20 glycosylhydrolase [Acidobacteriota bacterium]